MSRKGKSYRGKRSVAIEEKFHVSFSFEFHCYVSYSALFYHTKKGNRLLLLTINMGNREANHYVVHIMIEYHKITYY